MPTRGFLPTDVHGARDTIDQVHHEIHEGKHYTAYIYDADMSTGSSLSLLVTAPASGETHLAGLVKSSGAGSFVWSEAPNASGGAAITPYNNNRQSSNSASTTVVSDPTITSAGTTLLQSDVGATGTPQTRVGGEFAARQEWILDTDTAYLLEYTSAADSNKVTLIFEWYEED